MLLKGAVWEDKFRGVWAYSSLVSEAKDAVGGPLREARDGALSMALLFSEGFIRMRFESEVELTSP